MANLDVSQQQYNNDTSALLETISNIVTNGEITQEDKGNVSQLKTNYNESYSQVSADIDAVRNAQNSSELNSIKNDLLGLKQLENKVELAVSGTLNNKEVTSKLEIEVGTITSTVEAQDGRITQAQQTADKFNWIVKNGSSASNMELTDSFINIVSDEVNITAPEIKLEGVTTINERFKIDEDGYMSCTGAEIVGKLESTDGLRVIADSSATDGYKFRINSSGSVYSKGSIQVYGTANDGVHTTIEDGYLSVVGSNGSIVLNGSNNLGSTVSCYRTNTTEVDTIWTTTDYIDVTEGSFSTSNSYLYLSSGSNSATLGTSSFHSAGSTLGYSSAPWTTVYATNGTINTSDRTYKEDIRYIPNDKISVFNMNQNQAEFSYQDMYDFVKDDLYLATYKYKEIDGDRRYINFISQDLLVNEDGSDNVVGQFIVQAEESAKEQCSLQYSSMNYQGVLAGALKQSIAEIEELKAVVKQQQELIDRLLNTI